MNPFELYCDYLALRLHFVKWEYDYFLFRGTTPATTKAFRKRKDRYWFEKLSHLHSPHERILANCASKESVFIKDVVQDTETYLLWQGRMDTLTRTFTRELQQLTEIFDSNFLYVPGKHPHLVREYLGSRISLETITIISDLTDCVSYWGGYVDDDPLLEMVVRKIMKYSPFLDYDMEKFREILITSIER